MKKAICLVLLGLAVNVTMSSFAVAQHFHSVPHTTTHFDSVRHGNHFHNVPHTTTHYDNVVHHGHDYTPHTTTHLDAVRHNGHIDYVPHTTTHYHPNYAGAGVFLNQGERIISSSPIVSPTIISSVPSSSAVVTQSPPATLSGSISTGTVRSTLKPNVMPYTGRGVKILMPADIEANVNYLIDGVQDAEIRSGEEQLLKQKGSYEIRFSRGETAEGRSLGEGRYTLTEGNYRFVVTERGWDLTRDGDSASNVAPTLNRSPKKNTLPTLPASEQIPN